MHRRIGLSAGIVRISWMPGRIVEKIEVRFKEINYEAVEMSSINMRSVKNVRCDRRLTVDVSLSK